MSCLGMLELCRRPSLRCNTGLASFMTLAVVVALSHPASRGTAAPLAGGNRATGVFFAGVFGPLAPAAVRQ